jgi:PD-(D/E)XK nuclease superfamily
MRWRCSGGLLRISYSKYTSFLTNPERFRLYYILGLTTEGDETPTRMNLGRRRGSCFHALYEAKGESRYEEGRRAVVKEHGEDLVVRCESMMEVVPDLGPMFLVEESFEIPILDGKHSIMGRIDHGFTVDGHERIGDFKTTKGNRTKKEISEYFGTLETSAQSHFYLKAAAALGHPTDLFTYHVVFDRKDKDSKPKYVPLDLHIGPAEVNRTMAEVYAACETIEFLTNEYGTDKPWPHSNNWPCCGDKFFCGYQGLCGRPVPKGCTPPGFTQRYKDLIQVEGQ